MRLIIQQNQLEKNSLLNRKITMYIDHQEIFNSSWEILSLGAVNKCKIYQHWRGG